MVVARDASVSQNHLKISLRDANMRIFRVGPLHLDADLLRLSAGRSPLPVGPKVVETLLALVEFAPSVATKDELIARIWPDGFTGEPNLSQNIYVLRKLFRDHGLPEAIQTQPRVGYRLTVEAIPMLQTPSRRRGSRALIGAAIVACTCIVLALGIFSERPPSGVSATTESQRLYSIGRYYWNMRSRDAVRKSLVYFAQAIDNDPNNARAYAGMADANVTMGDYCFGTHKPSVYFSRAEQYAAQALAIDANSPEARASLAFIELHQDRTNDAVRELRTSLELDPKYAPAHEWYGIALLQEGDIVRGRAQLAAAARLDPLSVATIAWLGSAAYGERRYRDAILYSKMALELSPTRMDSLAIIGQSYAALGNIRAARTSFQRYAAVSPYYGAQAAAMLALADARARDVREARREYAYARDHASDVDDVDLAAAAKALGDFQFAQEISSKQIAHVSWAAIENAHRFALEEDERTGS